TKQIIISQFLGVPTPIAFYPLNINSTIHDFADRPPYSALASNVEFTSGPANEANGAYRFKGATDSFIQFPNTGGILDVKYSITLMCWVRPGGQDGPLFNYKRQGAWGVHIWIASNGRFFTRITKFGSYAFLPGLSTDLPLQQGRWYHVAATYDSNTGVNSIYVDGVLTKTQNIGTGYRISTNDPAIRMGVKVGDGRLFNGAITQLGIYNVSLTGDQIRAVIKQGVPTPIAFYPLNINSTIHDFAKRPAYSALASNVEFTSGPANECNGAYQFKGATDSFIQFPNTGGILDVKYSITLMCWVRPGGQDGPLFNYKRQGAWGVHIWIASNGRFFTRITKFGSYAFLPGLSTDLPLQQGRWYHVAATYDSNTGINSIYVDGVLTKIQNIGTGYRISTNDPAIRMGVKRGSPDLVPAVLAKIADTFRVRTKSLPLYLT
ncbi:hypothetical protein P5673_005298, partial [Acropora cervicornis]